MLGNLAISNDWLRGGDKNATRVINGGNGLVRLLNAERCVMDGELDRGEWRGRGVN